MSAAQLKPLAIDVVSVQSQVVYGRVGNNVALPVFHSHGLRAAGVPTVVLSNTPHYPSMHGGAIAVDWFDGWLADLQARGALDRLRAVQCGYLGSAAQAQALQQWLQNMRRVHPRLQVCIDPVIGDADVGIYVDPALVDAYRDGLMAQADGITPNTYELGQLSGRRIDTLDDLVAAARSLMHGQLRWVVATSALPGQWPDGRMRMVLVGASDVQVFEHERIDASPKGTGDLFSAALASRLLHGTSLPEAIRAAGQLVVQALRDTAAAHSAELLIEDALR